MKIFRVRSALRDFHIEFGRYDNLETLVALLTNHLLATSSNALVDFHHDEEVEVAGDGNNNGDAQNKKNNDNDAINIASSTDAAVISITKKRSNSTGSDSFSRNNKPYSVVYSLRSRIVDTSPVQPKKKGKAGRKKKEASQTSPVKKTSVAAAEKKKKGRKARTKSTGTQVGDTLEEDVAIPAVHHSDQATETNEFQQEVGNMSQSLIAGTSTSHHSEDPELEGDALGSNSPVVTYEKLFEDMRYSYGNEQQNFLRVASSNSNDESSEAPPEAAEGPYLFGNFTHQNFNEKSHDDDEQQQQQQKQQQQQQQQQHIADEEENSENESGSKMDVQDPEQKEEAYEPFSDAQSYPATLNESEEDNDPEINDLEESNSENDHSDAQGVVNVVHYDSDEHDDEDQMEEAAVDNDQDRAAEDDDQDDDEDDDPDNEDDQDDDEEVEDNEFRNDKNDQADESVVDLCDSDEEKEESGTVASAVDQNRPMSPVDSNTQVAIMQSTTEAETENPESQVTLTQPLPPTVSTPVRHAIEAFQKLGTRFISVVVGEPNGGEKLSLQEYDLLKSLLEKNKPLDEITSAPNSATLSVDEGALVVHSNTVTALTLKEPEAVKSVTVIAIQAAEDEQEIVPFKEFSSLPPVPESAVKQVIPRRSVDSGTWDSRNSFLPSPSPASLIAPAQPFMTSAVAQQKSSVTSLADILSRRNSLRDLFQATDDGNSSSVTESRKRSFVEFHDNDEDKYSDSVLFSALKKATVETSHSAQPNHRQLVSSLGSGVIHESKNRLQGSDSAFPHRSSYIPVFKSNTARFTGNETSSRQSFGGPQNQPTVSRAPLSLSYSERRKLQRQSVGRDGATTVSKKILETLSGINTPIENERNRPVAISWKEFGPSSKKSEGESARRLNLTAQEPVSQIKADTQPKSHDHSSESNQAPSSSLSKVVPKPTFPVISNSEPPPLPKPALTTSSQEENSKKTVTFSAIDEEFIFEEPSDDLVASSNLTTTSSIGVDKIQYLFSPPQNRKAVKSSDLAKASSSLPLKDKIVPNSAVAVTKPKETSDTPPVVVPAVNIWATAATDKVKCNVCMVPNSKGATKCVSCESPLKVEVAAVPKVKSIWDVNTSDFIKCSACMVQNSKTAVKCASCESPLATTSAAAASSAFPSVSAVVEAAKPAPSSEFVFGIKSSSVSETTAAVSATSSQPIAFGSAPTTSETVSKVSTGFVFGVPATSTVSKTGIDFSLSDSIPFQLPPVASAAATAAVPSKLTFEFPKTSMSSNAATTTFGGAAAGTFGGIGSGAATTFGVDAPKPLSQIPQFSGFSASTTSAWNAPGEKAVNLPSAKPNEDVAPSLKSNPFGKPEESSKPSVSNIGISRPFSSDDDSGDQQDSKRKSTRHNESETTSTTVSGTSFFAPSAIAKQDDKVAKAPFTFGGIGSGSSSMSFSSTAGTTGPFSGSSFSSANAFPAIPAPAALTETKPKLLNFGTTSTAPPSATTIEPKLNFGSTPAPTGSLSQFTTSTSAVPSFGMLPTATTTAAAATTAASAQSLVKVQAQPFGTGSSTSFGSQPSFGSAGSSFSTIAPTSSTAASEPTFGSSTFGGIFNAASKSVAPVPSSFNSSALGALGSSSTNAFSSAFSSTPASSASSFAPSVPSASVPFGQSANKPDGGSGIFGFGSTTTTSGGPFSVNQPSNTGFGYAGNESPSMDMAGDGSNLSAPVANSNTSRNQPAFNFGGNSSSTGVGSGSAFAGAANPFGAIIAQTQPAATFGVVTANSFGGGNSNSTSNVFGGAFQSNINQPQSQSQQPVPFGGSGSSLGMFGGAPVGGAFGGFTTGTGTGMGGAPGAATTPAFGGGGGGGFSMGSTETKRKIVKAKRPGASGH